MKSNSSIAGDNRGQRVFKRALFMLLLAVAIRSDAVGTNDDALWRPRLVTPAMVALDSPANREFTAEVRAAASANNWQASIANDLKTWPCQIVAAMYSTINRGTAQSGKTTVGSNCLIMSYVHLAHDCHVGNGVILSNGTQFAGHVEVEDKAIVSGLCTVHQFTRIGRNAYVGGSSRVPQDVPPFVMAVGNPIRLRGLNSVGLRRSNFSDDTIMELKRAYRLLFRSELNLSQALERATTDLQHLPEVDELLAFMQTASQRGFTM